MKQLSSSELNNMSKEDLAAMVLQMQQVHQQLQQQQKQMELQQKQMEQQIHTLNEKIAIMNARHFGRSTQCIGDIALQVDVLQISRVPLHIYAVGRKV